MIRLRYKLVFTLLRPLAYLYARLTCNYHAVRGPMIPPGQPVLILANHNCNLDPIFVAASFRRPIFFVASDHIFRLGFLSSVLNFLVAPIPIVKSQIDLRTIRDIMNVMRKGGTVGLFPEGNRSFNGLTGWIPPVTGKLVRQLNATVLLYRIEGGYLSTPRWAAGSRHGRIRGETVRRIDPPELANMTPEEINEIIRETLNVDAYAVQHTSKAIHFRGKNLAEALERALFVCPKCRRLDTLRSRDDHFACTCGFAVHINDLGFFEAADAWTAEQQAAASLPETVAAWDIWQRQALITMLDDPDVIDWSGGKLIFTDDSESLFSCERARRAQKIDQGRLTMFADRLVFDGRQGPRVYPLSEITKVIVHGPQVLQFATSAGRIFEVKSPARRSAYKYVLLFNLLHQKQNGEAYVFNGF